MFATQVNLISILTAKHFGSIVAIESSAGEAGLSLSLHSPA